MLSMLPLMLLSSFSLLFLSLSPFSLPLPSICLSASSPISLGIHIGVSLLTPSLRRFSFVFLLLLLSVLSSGRSEVEEKCQQNRWKEITEKIEGLISKDLA